MTMRTIKIEWIDSCSSNTEWTLLSDICEDIQPIKITTIGFLIQETDDCITVAQNYGIDPEQACNFMTIPKGCIKKIEELKI